MQVVIVYLFVFIIFAANSGSRGSKLSFHRGDVLRHVDLYDNDVTETGLIRQKRSAQFLAMRGSEAVKRLLSGTTQLESKKKYIRLFKKDGNFKTALKDFKRMKPAHVKKTSYPFGQTIVYGRVGNRFLMIEKLGQNGKSTLTILKQGDEGISDTADKIIYMDD